MELHRQLSGMQIICLLIWRDSIHDEVVALICIWIYWIREFKCLDTTTTWRRHYYLKLFGYSNRRPLWLGSRGGTGSRTQCRFLHTRQHYISWYFSLNDKLALLQFTSILRQNFWNDFWDWWFSNPHKSVARFWRRREWRTTWVLWFGMVQTSSVHNDKVIQLYESDIGYSHRILSLTTSASAA